MSQGWDEGTGNKVSIDEELMAVGRVAEGDRGGKEEGCEWRDQIGGCGDFQKSVTDMLKTIPVEDFQHCYQKWEQRFHR